MGLVTLNSSRLTAKSFGNKSGDPASKSNHKIRIHLCGANLWQMFRQDHHLNGKLGGGVDVTLQSAMKNPLHSSPSRA